MIRPWILVAVTFGLFAVWSNSFLAMSYLLGSEVAARQLDWRALTVARFLPAGAICGAYCLVFRREEALRVVRESLPRLLACGAMMVPGYNLALYYGQEHGVPAPMASLTTALLPLFVMTLAAIFLGERLTARRVAGFSVAIGGMALVALARRGEGSAAYPLLIAIIALAPLCWSIHSVLSKPMMHRVSPIVWTFMATFAGAVMVLPLLPGDVWRQWSALDGAGWSALLYLVLPCTVVGFVLWTWLLKHLPASSVGFTVFLNPPLTMASKFLLAVLLPTTFVFTIRAQEWVGGGLALVGVAIALWPRRAVPVEA